MRRLWLATVTLPIAGLLLALTPEPAPVLRQPRFDEPGAAARHDLLRRLPTDGGADMPARYEAATARLMALERFSSRINRTIPAAQGQTRVWLSGSLVVPAGDRSSAAGILDAWTPLGPGNIGGRTRVVRFHPTVPTTLFAAGVSGGIWKSDDNGTTWRPTGDGLTNIAINALAIDPQHPDVMYVGTGEGYFREEIRGTGLPLRGTGIYATANGGHSWQQLPATNTPDFHWVNDVELGVTDPRRMYAATRSGVWRSTDAGATWAQLLRVNVRGGCLDLALRPDRSEDVLFASCGSYEQATVYRFARAADRSDAEVVLQQPDMGRTSLAIAPSNPDIMYALAASNADGPNGIFRQGLLAVYRSDRGGAPGSWQVRVTNSDATFLNTMLLTNMASAAARVCNPQGSTVAPVTMGWYNNVIAVDPRDPERVWAGGVDWFRSDDGGRNWGLASFNSNTLPSHAHVDQHGIAFHPQYDGAANQIALVGGDGGIYRTTNARAATSNGPRAACTGGTPIQIVWTSLNRGYGVTQFYHGTPSADGRSYIAGAQDNGTLFGSDDRGPDNWVPVFGGDGGFSAISATSGNTWLVEFQWASLGRTTNGGSTFDRPMTGLDPIVSDTLGPDGNYLFISPFTLDPSSNRVWLGGNFLYRGDSFGLSWAKTGAAMPDGARISAIAVAPRSGATLVIGTEKGDLVRTGNATASTGVQFATTRPRNGWVTSIAFDSRTDGVVYATYGNFGGAHVWRSTDGGASWQSIDGAGSTGVPDVPVHSIVVDPDDSLRLYLGTDLGVLTSIDGGRTWMSEETGFGPAVTMWLSMIRTPSGQKQLFAFTHGRGAWRVTIR
ncbi:MAG TPA: hypothetical protein VFP85_07565 [Vicinamibacterales bacterium]|nr:hypothetical protein [Vicinamibacterales bacterium]